MRYLQTYFRDFGFEIQKITITIETTAYYYINVHNLLIIIIVKSAKIVRHFGEIVS